MYILSEVSKLFDPLGLLGPITILRKVIFAINMAGTQWDDQVSETVRTMWSRIKNECSSIESVQIPREVVRLIELHGFSNASGVAYEACTYYRSISETEKITVNLLYAKSRVALVKRLKTPVCCSCVSKTVETSYQFNSIVNRSSIFVDRFHNCSGMDSFIAQFLKGICQSSCVIHKRDGAKCILVAYTVRKQSCKSLIKRAFQSQLKKTRLW